MQHLGDRLLCQSVRRILLECGGHFPSIAEMAVSLGMSIRTFRRRLAGQGTNFLSIMDEVRFELAVRYLEDRRLTTELIAQRLGYSESANFRAAFRRWTGSSPRFFNRHGARAKAAINFRIPIEPLAEAD
jgi:AraC-like DNA-binding protein